MSNDYPTLEPPETYLTTYMNQIALVCERQECRLVTLASEGRVLSSTRYFNVFLQDRLLPERLVMARAEHVATHAPRE